MCSDTVLHSDGSFEKLKTLKYYIHSYSSCLPTFVPENVLENNSRDQTSRWSAENNNASQFIMLKLEKLAIVKSITFGKYEETHMWNLKKFKIYGGPTADTQIELLDGGLNNDGCPESFNLRHTLGDFAFPCRYIKVVPLQSWGCTYNFSIWFVELKGSDDFDKVEKAVRWLDTYREKEVIRLCLKHLRLLNYQNVFNELADASNVKLEDSSLSELFDLLVLRGDFNGSEYFMENAISNGRLNKYIAKQEYHPVWKMLKNEKVSPGIRGGHQMCIDPVSETIFLLGGWDGHQDLSDFWAYHIPDNKWRLLSYDVEAEGGPSPRSCHKMSVHPIRREIFVLGRFLDGLYRTAYNLKSDFYVYNIDSNCWTLLSENTHLVGGPPLIFDHQICMDVASSVMYVFGGRILTPATCGNAAEERPHGNATPLQEPQFSGLYTYNIVTRMWTSFNRSYHGGEREKKCNLNSLLKPRAGHCMLFHPVYRKLYIFHGQQSKEHLTDFLSYNVDTEEIEVLSDYIKQDKNELPPSGFTQRTTIDTELDEIYVLSGLSKDKERRDEKAQTSFWAYSLSNYKWTCVYKNENYSEQYWSRMQYTEPCPRYAHQLVYDEKRKLNFLFGGNPVRKCLPKLRLNDFWSLQLCRTSQFEMLQRCKLLIRKCRFQELSRSNKSQALEFLQSEFSELITSSNIEQEKQNMMSLIVSRRSFQFICIQKFRNRRKLYFQNTVSHQKQNTELQSLAVLLFSEKQIDIIEESSTGEEDKLNHRNRCKLFEMLCSFFPESMTEPKSNLNDMISL